MTQILVILSVNHAAMSSKDKRNFLKNNHSIYERKNFV